MDVANIVLWISIVCLWGQFAWFVWQRRKLYKFHGELLDLQRLTIRWIELQQKFFDAAKNSNVEAAEHWFYQVREVEVLLSEWRNAK